MPKGNPNHDAQTGKFSSANSLKSDHNTKSKKDMSVQSHYENHPAYKAEMARQQEALAATATDVGIDPRTGMPRVARAFKRK